mmetsp:Transcript_41497/g.120126  ORF Transcript_41497/g.120126 Transcript_41497/m.120126 type:complete len:216 (+) Transcript_41497:1194-1841(+)
MPPRRLARARPEDGGVRTSRFRVLRQEVRRHGEFGELRELDRPLRLGLEAGRRGHHAGLHLFDGDITAGVLALKAGLRGRGGWPLRAHRGRRAGCGHAQHEVHHAPEPDRQQAGLGGAPQACPEGHLALRGLLRHDDPHARVGPRGHLFLPIPRDHRRRHGGDDPVQRRGPEEQSADVPRLGPHREQQRGCVRALRAQRRWHRVRFQVLVWVPGL